MSPFDEVALDLRRIDEVLDWAERLSRTLKKQQAAARQLDAHSKDLQRLLDCGPLDVDHKTPTYEELEQKLQHWQQIRAVLLDYLADGNDPSHFLKGALGVDLPK